MIKYTLQERLPVIQKFYEDWRSFVNTQRALRENYGPHNSHSVGRIAWNSVDNFVAVKDSSADVPNLSITWHILPKDLSLQPYKIGPS